MAKTAHGVVLPTGQILVRQTGLMTAQACIDASLRMADDFGPRVAGWVWDYTGANMKIHRDDLPLIAEAVSDVAALNIPPIALVATRRDFWLTREYSVARALAGQAHRSFISGDEAHLWAHQRAMARESVAIPRSLAAKPVR